MHRLTASEAITGLEAMLGNIQHLQSKGAYAGDVRLRVETTYRTYVSALRMHGFKTYATEYEEAYRKLTEAMR